MARAPRIFDSGSLLHVLSRATQGEAIFSEEGEGHLFIERLGQQGQAWDGKVYAYVVMPNHFHLLVEVGKQPLSALMQPLLSWYAARYNWAQHRQGHVFQSRYQSILLEREAHLLELIRYIHLNPVRAGLVRVPDDYTASSHCVYCGRGGQGWVAANQALRLFSDDRSSASRQYRHFVREGISLGRRPEWYRSRRPPKGRAAAGATARGRPDVAALANRLGLPAEDVADNVDLGSPETRLLLVYAAVKAEQLSAAEVASTLRCHRTTVHRDVLKARQLRKRSPAFRQRLARLLPAASPHT